MKYIYPIKSFDLEKFMSEIPLDIKEVMVATSEEGENRAFYFREDIELPSNLKNRLEASYNSHDGLPLPKLRIFKFIPKDANPLNTDFSIVGLRKKSPKKDRGRKIESEYLDPETNEVVVRKKFSDNIIEGELRGLIVKFEFIDEENKVGKYKEEIVKEWNEWEAETIQRQRRQRQKDFLVREGKRYIALGSSSWEDAINNHTVIDQETGQIDAILKASPEGNMSIKDAILYQITGSVS